ncbi:MAG: DUF490 domain-containing protein [Flavobacteriaceae bacterium]|nr:MAG: DUF490 domain-containing protein [Flavobacteriaceae bacterium]
MPVVQTRFAEIATNSINEKYGTKINIDRLQASFISWDTSLKGIYVEDYKKDTLFYIHELTTSILNLRNLSKGKLEFGDIAIEDLTFKLKTYKGEQDTNLDVFVKKLDVKKPRSPNTPPFYLSSSHVDITDSRFKLIDEHLEKAEILNFKNLNISADDFLILGPDVSTKINSLSLNAKTGLSVEKLATSFKYSLTQMRFDSLAIETPKSSLNGNLVFNYDREDFKDFLNLVQIEAQFEESILAFDEVNILYNELGKGKEAVFSSKITGVLNDLSAEDLFLQSDNSGISGNFNFKNFFNKEEPFLLKAEMRNITTSYYELRSLMPGILGKALPSSIEKLGQFTARGTATITNSSIVSKLNLNTAIGSSYSDLELTDFNDMDAATYKGFVSLIDFDLGRFANSKSFGKTTLDFNVEGKGFVQENLNTEVIGEVYAIDFNGYTYKNVKVSGVLKDQLFDGSVQSNDENLKLNFNGLADFSENMNNFNFIASVGYADFKKLNFINDSISIFRGNVNMDISGNSLDNIVGDINFSETNYRNKNDTYYFDDFKVSSIFENDSLRTITINSPDIITGYIKGRFKVKELGKLLQNSVGSIYTNYKPFEISEGQRLDFNFNIYNKIVEVFLPEVTFGTNTFMRGNIIADEGDFKLTIKSPSFEAYGNKLEAIDVKIDNKNPLFNTYISVADVSTAYYDVQDFSLINTTLKDTLFFRAEFKGGSEYNDSYNLNFYHTFNKENKSVIGLKTSEIIFKGNTWVLNKDGNTKNKVIINRNLDSISIEEIVMNNDVQEQIRLNGKLADSTYKDLQMQFKIVSLDKIAPEIDSLKLGGEVNGTLNVLQKDGVYLPSSNLAVTDFSINDLRLGNLSIGIWGNKNLTNFAVNSSITDNGREKVNVYGNILMDGEVPMADLVANFYNFSLEPFNPLGEGVISHIRGDLNGSAKIVGNVSNPDISGLLTIDNGGIGIPYLNVDYDFGYNSRVRLYDQTFHFENMYLTDVNHNSSATLDGTINHFAFKDWNLNLNVDTNDDRFLILDTAFEEETLYYGTGFFNGTGRIFGPTTALTIEVAGATARGTALKIPISDVASVGDYSFINFIEKNDKTIIESERTLADTKWLELEFDLDVTRDAEVEIVLDQKTGSSLKGRGEGPLLIEINTNGKFNMYGDFVVVEGEYHYKYGGVLDKTFKVRPGGRIIWDEDPLGAILSMEAVYSLNANPAPLLDNSYNRRIPTDVVVRLGGELESPSIEFNIEFPGTNSIIKSELQYSLQDPAVEERNAFFLLAQGTFVNEETGINQQAVTGNLIQTASGLLNQILGGNNDKFDLGLSYEQGGLDKELDIKTENRIGVTVSTQISDRVLLNGRLGLPVGGGVSETVVAGEFEVQILLNEEGTLSAKIFNRENEIQQFLAERQGYTQGVGVSYEVDFNNFKELMRKIFKKKEKEKQRPEPMMPPSTSTMGKDSLIQFTQKSSPPKLK